jgi:hypothetical protein
LKEPPDLDTTLRDFPWVIVRFRCTYCRRGGDSKLAVLAWLYGANSTLRDMLDKFVTRCPWDPHNPSWKPQKYGMRCGAYCPDVGRQGPPDLPPSMTGLTIIEGGKDDQLSEAPVRERRRKVRGA